MITDAEIKEVAKAYCVELGVDPDLMLFKGLVPGKEPAYLAYVDKARQAIAMHRALKAIEP